MLPPVAVIAAGLLWQAYCMWLAVKYSDVELPAVFGNRPHNIEAAAREKPDDSNSGLRFAVITDTHGSGTVHALMAELKKHEPEFVFLVGDAANDPEPGDHQHLQVQMVETSMNCPVFYIVGNHDIGEPYGIEEWEETYGPCQFFFKRAGNLFIALNIWEHCRAESGVRFLEETLRNESAGMKRIFVLNHVPPDVGYGWQAHALPEQERLLALLQEYNVTYFISGDYHGYSQVRCGCTAFVVSGGGGGKLRGGALGFHHAVIFTVHDEAVQTRLCVVPPSSSTLDYLRYSAFTRFIPFARKNMFLVIVIDIVCIAVLVLFAHRSTRLRRRPVKPAAQPI